MAKSHAHPPGLPSPHATCPSYSPNWSVGRSLLFYFLRCQSPNISSGFHLPSVCPLAPKSPLIPPILGKLTVRRDGPLPPSPSPIPLPAGLPEEMPVPNAQLSPCPALHLTCSQYTCHMQENECYIVCICIIISMKKFRRQILRHRSPGGKCHTHAF